MQRFIAVPLALLVTAASAKDVSVVQNHAANVYGIVQAGPQVGSVTLRQVGVANVAGIVQSGQNPRARVEQSGAMNSAFIGQTSTSVRGAGFLP